MKTCYCCKEKTKSWGIMNMQYYCKRCREYYKGYGKFPTKKQIKFLKEEGLWE